MPRSRQAELLDEIERTLRQGDRYVDMAATLRVWRCSCGVHHAEWPSGKPHDGVAQPAELATDRVWGGRYDRLLKRYVGPGESPVELPCHSGQVPILLLDGNDAYGRQLNHDQVLRILALGSPGAGKTMGAVLRAILMALDRPNSAGGLVAPTNDRRQILWDALCGKESQIPRHWIAEERRWKKEVELANGTVIQVLAARKSSTQSGNPLQGRSWDWAVVDESQNVDDDAHTEIATRGRRAGKAYRIFETATNAQVPAFRVRLEGFKANPQNRRVNFTGFENPWVEPEYWHKMRGEMSERDFREKILAEDVKPERMVYPRFSLGRHVQPRGKAPTWLSDIERARWGKLEDVTQQITRERYERACKTILAQDFGVLVNATIALKCYMNAAGERVWWAIDEITSGGATDLHAHKLSQYYDPDECVVIADPHFNSKESDKSDYNIMREAGWDVVPAVPAGRKITRKSRIAMFQALLEDARGVTRFFIDCDAHGKESCTRLVRALLTSQYNEHGEAERDKKSGLTDPSHWPSAVQYGLYPFEKDTVGSAPATFGALDYKRPPTGDKPAWWKG